MIIAVLFKLKYSLGKVMSFFLCRLCPWLHSSTISSTWTKLHLNLHTSPIFVASHRSFNFSVFIAIFEYRKLELYGKIKV